LVVDLAVEMILMVERVVLVEVVGVGITKPAELEHLGKEIVVEILNQRILLV
jgi:hypothetical protein